MTITVKLNEAKIKNKVTNDELGKFVAQQWKFIIDPYTPRATGMLMNNVSLEVPFQIHYKEGYASAVYYNRRGVKFIQGGGNGRNPYATQEWDIAAANAGQTNKLYRIINSYLGG